MNYEFHVGDYVETVGGATGYVSDANNMWWRCVHKADRYNSDFYYSIIGLDDDEVSKYFNRIGKYDFTKKEKKKIEQLEKDLPIKMKAGDLVTTMQQYCDDGYHIVTYDSKMIDKINELVNAVNLLLDKSTES